MTKHYYTKGLDIPQDADSVRYPIPEGYTAKIENGTLILVPKESEDERIRKRLFRYFEGLKINGIEVCFEGLIVQKVLAWLEKQKEQKPIKMEVYEIGKGTTVCGQDYKCKKDYRTSTCWYIKDAIYHCSRDGYLNDQNGVSWSCTPEWFNEYIQSNTEWAEEEKTRFVSGQFLQCKLSFDEFKEGEHYWLEYVGDDIYVGRSDNILNQKFHITPRQLYTLFSQQLEEVQGPPQEEKQVSLNYEPPFDENPSDNEIIEALIHHLNEQDGFLTAINCVSTKAILGWLEKQKELPTNEEMLRTLRVEYEKGVADTIAKYEQKEQKPEENSVYPHSLDEAIQLYYYTYGNGKGGFDYLSLPKFQDIVEDFVKSYGQKSVDDKAFEEWVDGWWEEHKDKTYHEVAMDKKEFKNFCRGIRNMYKQNSEWNEDYNEKDLQTRFAFYTYKDDPSVLYLSNVFVEETSRNHGFGTHILKATEKVAETIGAITIRLKVKQNSPANAWYRKHGYGYIAFEDGYDWLEKNLEYIKPNKQEWSEEDENMMNNIIRVLSTFVDTVECESNPSLSSSYPTYLIEIDWLKSLKNRGNFPQSNTNSPNEWNADDESAFGDLMWCIEQAGKSATVDNMGNVWYAEKWLKNRLKSLRPSWKPSEEQMRQLGYVAEQNKHNMLGKELMTLYDDLKKLM